MAANASQDGSVIHVTAATGGVTAGELRLVQEIFGVVQKSTVSGSVYALGIDGVYLLPKVADTGTSFAQGGFVYGVVTATGALTYNVTGNAATGDNPVVGTAMMAAATGDTTAHVKLRGTAVVIPVIEQEE